MKIMYSIFRIQSEINLYCIGIFEKIPVNRKYITIDQKKRELRSIWEGGYAHKEQSFRNQSGLC